MNYTGVPCPVCNNAFISTDDVVVCPECGTPHHRHCWHEVGHCINQDKHADNFVYTLPVSSHTTTCANCGAEINASASFCENCGAPVVAGTNVVLQQQPPIQNTTVQMPGNSVFFFGTNEASPQSQVIDDIPIADWATYIGPNAGYYIFHFQRMDASGRKTGATISAMLFAPLYFFYRKMWKIGLISGIVNIIFQIPTLVLQFSQLGLIPQPSNVLFWQSISGPLSIVLLIIDLCWGLFAINLYRKNAGAQIKKMKLESATQEEYQEKLRKTSGPNRVVFVIGFFLSLLYIFS